MARYLTLVQTGLAKLSECVVERVPRTENLMANTLVRIDAILFIKEAMLLPIYFQIAFSIATMSVCSIVESYVDWMHDIVRYLQTGELPKEKNLVHKVQVQAARFTMIEDCLYRRSFGGPYLKCLGDSKAQYVLVELHEGVCDNYAGICTLEHRAHTQGYYWPP